MMNEAVISVGSNINSKENIKKAQNIIKREQTLISISKFKKTSPIGYLNQPDFINGAFLIKTKLEIIQLKLWLKEVEKRLKRKRDKNKNGPRTIDLDITVWNDKIIDKDFYKRDFIKEAVLELLPKLQMT